jgi:sugar phosphate permease
MAEKQSKAKAPEAKAKAPETKKAAGDDLQELGWIGHGIPAALGVLALVAAFYAWRAGIQITLSISLLVAGVLLPFLAWYSLQRSRAAWAFLIALCIVLGVMTLFGAPKVRSLVGINLGVALVIPGLFGFAAFCLSVVDQRYKNQG